jgi:outer membrane receptor protein involved in Fe transport
MNKFWLPGLTIIITALSSFAQISTSISDGSITGKVVENSTKAPMEFANVVLFRANDSTQVSGGITDEKGIFSISKLFAGDYFLRLSFIGFDTLSTRVFSLRNERMDLGTLVIAVSPIVLGKMEVTVAKPIYNNSIDKKVYNVEKDILSQSSSATELLQNIPSVAVDVDGNVSLRGTTNVAFFINGKPSLLMRKNSATVLEQMPANTIEKIEVITNPSAKYSPEGVGGIINIVLKKESQDRLNGTLSANFSNLDRYNGNLTLNYRKSKVNLFGSYGLRRMEFIRRGTDARIETDSAGRQSYYDNNTSSAAKPIAHIANLGLEYSPSDKNHVEISGNYFYRDFHRDESGRTILSDSLQQITTDFMTNRNNGETEKEYEVNSSYEHGFGRQDHSLKFEYNYSGYGEDEDNYYTEIYSVPGIPNSLYNSLIKKRGHLATVSAEYSYPISEVTKVEAGYTGEFTRDDSRNYWENYDTLQNSWLTDYTKTNRFLFLQDIHALYTTWGHTFGKLSCLAGIRAEQANISSDLVTSDSTILDNYFQVYPTLHLSYRVNDQHEFQLNYSHRVNRPESEEHNPFAEYHDPRNLEAGNPKIKPEQIHSIEFGYNLKKEHLSILPTLYYRYKYNAFTELHQIVNDSIMLTTFTNLANDQSAGLEISLNTEVKKLLSLNFSSDMFYQVIDASNLGYSDKKSIISWNAKLSADLRLIKSNLWQFNAYYRPAELTPQGKSQALFYMNLGMRQDLFQDRASLTLTISDVFNSIKWSNQINTPALYEKTTRKRTSQIVYLGFVYRFGGSTNKDKSEFKFEDEGK